MALGYFCKLGELNKNCPNRIDDRYCTGKNPSCTYLAVRTKTQKEIYDEKRKAKAQSAWYEKYYAGTRQVKSPDEET